MLVILKKHRKVGERKVGMKTVTALDSWTESLLQIARAYARANELAKINEH